MMERLATIRCGAVCAALMLGPTAFAQNLVDLAPAAYRTAIHSGPTTNGGVYGTWVSGVDFKASFHDGFVFYPLLGASYPSNLPLRWVTEGTAGEAQVEFTADQARFDHGDFVEVYDVRVDGIEQSFVFEHAPATPGDLIVRGTIETDLVADPVAAAHQELLFRTPSGEPVLRYGAATVFDAAGKRADVTTAWNGSQIELRITADFVADAVFPVTLDPLIAAVPVAGDLQPVQDLDTVTAPVGNSSRLLIVLSRVFAGGDVDSFAVAYDPDYTNPVLVFSDVNATWSTKEGRCAYCGDTDRWAMVYEQELFAPTTSTILTYCHALGNTTLNSGTTSNLPVPAGNTARNPDVGGRYAGGGDNVLVVYTTDVTTTQANTDHTEAWGVLVDTNTGLTVSQPDTLDWFTVGTTYDREHPTLVKMSDGQPGFWIVAWHELFRPAVPDDWDTNLSRFDFNGNHMAQRYRMGLGAHPWNKRYPQLAGGSDHFLMTLTFGSNSANEDADEIHVQRFDWPDSEWDPVIQPVVVVDGDNATPDFAYPKVSFDTNTRSHWALSYQRNSSGDSYVARIGMGGEVLESQAMFSQGGVASGPTSVSFVPDNGGSFAAFYATDGSGYPVWGTGLLYPGGAQNTIYGTGCGGVISATQPYIGSQYFTISVAGAFPNLPTILGAANTSANVTFAPLLPGCYLNIGAPVTALSAMSDGAGDAAITFPIPTTLPGGFSMFFQWIYLDSAGGTLGISSTQGLRCDFE